VNSTHISEIYTSVQGEGPFTGEKQIFVRLAGCPLRCDYCDTPSSLIARGHPRLSVAEALKRTLAERRTHRAQTVSLTGGEPLAHVGFLKEFIPALKKKKFRVYLETAGVHPKNLKAVVKNCDVVSMDMKLPSAIGRAYWNEHAEFVAAGGDKVFVKVVIERHSKPDELKRVVDILSRRARPPLLVLQPVTPEAAGIEAPSEKQLADFYAMASKKLPRVLVMPQQHKLWGVR
jgi:organic radical activating enzyme